MMSRLDLIGSVGFHVFTRLQILQEKRVQKKRAMIRRLVLSGGGKTNPTSHLFGESTKFFDGRENRKANSCLLIAIDMGMGQHVGPKGTTELGDV
jgi:hypothetical protein